MRVEIGMGWVLRGGGWIGVFDRGVWVGGLVGWRVGGLVVF